MLYSDFYSKNISLRILFGILMSVCLGYVVFMLLSLLGSSLFSMSYQEYLQQVQEATLVLNSKLLIQYILMCQSISIFLIPAIVMTFVINNKLGSYLGLDFLPSKLFIFIIAQVIIINIPGMNFWASLNSKFVTQWLGNNSIFTQLYEQNERIASFILESSQISELGYNLFFMALVPAVCEEFFFRGMLQKYLVNSMKNIHIAIVISSIIFSLMHADVINFLPRVLMGIIFGYLYFVTKNLWLPIIAHFIHNAMIVCIYFAISNGWLAPHFDTIGEFGNGVVFGIISVCFVGYFFKIILERYLAKIKS